MEKPLISVIVPAYNAEKHLGAALDSLLFQTYPNLEIILTDDGSTDQTRSIAKNHPVQCTYIYQANRGPSEARNSGIRRARGDYIAFLDSDDVYLPDKLLSQFDYLDRNPQIDMVLSAVQGTDEKLNFFASPMTCFLFGAALVRKTVFDRVGLCNPDYLRAEDLDWYLRAIDSQIPIAHQSEIGLLYRRHPGGISNDRVLNHKYVFLVLREASKRNMQKARVSNRGTVSCTR